MSIKLEDQAAIFEEIVVELDKALSHSKICVDHFNNKEVPRACAHSFALEGHMVNITNLLNQAKVNHSVKAQI